jgi:hypothetical protein
VVVVSLSAPPHAATNRIARKILRMARDYSSSSAKDSTSRM